MSETTLTATIKVRQVKAGPQAYIEYPTKKGGQQAASLSAQILSQPLAMLLAKSPKELEGKEVEYLLEGGKVQKVREAGTPWESTSAAPHTRRVQGNAPQSQQTGEHFENPYNFVPAPPRDTSHPSLGDAEPAHHHRWHPDLWSGRIQIELTTCTPLLIPDLGRDIAQDHKAFGVRIDEDSNPYLPPTSIKGALRAAYEAVTNSRMGIFQEHNDPLALRMPAREAIRLVPCRIFAGSDKSLEAQLLPGEAQIGLGGKPSGDGTGCLMYAAWLHRYEKYNKHSSPRADKAERHCAKRYPDGTLPDHGDRVFVRTIRRAHPPRFSFLEVTDIQKATASQPCPGGWTEGYVFASGPNVMNKHEERVFLVTNSAHPLPVKQMHRQRWRELIKNYQSVHEKELSQRRSNGQQPNHYLGHDPGQTGFSRHVFVPGAESLESGTLCYAEIETDNRGKPTKLLDLYPVSISRMLYEEAPVKRLPQGVKPPAARSELSPADRVFGWVKADGNGSYKGQLRIGAVTCLDGLAAIERGGDEDGKPLAILGQPKPAQARFYAAQNVHGEPLETGIDKKSGYTQGGGLRGRKVYPHQPQAEDPSYWDTSTDAASATPTRISGKTVYREWQSHDNSRTDQNRSITAWVRPGTRFTVAIDVINLSAVELGALLWLLCLDDGCYLRLGGGKPLGFGSVRLSVTGLDLRDGQALRADYRAFDEEARGGKRIVSLDQANGMIEAYRVALPAAVKQPDCSFGQLPVIRAFLNAAKGGTLPVHYPRTDRQERPQGESFEWFVQNEKYDNRRHERHTLPALWTDDNERGLPVLRKT